MLSPPSTATLPRPRSAAPFTSPAPPTSHTAPVATIRPPSSLFPSGSHGSPGSRHPTSDRCRAYQPAAAIVERDSPLPQRRSAALDSQGGGTGGFADFALAVVGRTVESDPRGGPAIGEVLQGIASGEAESTSPARSPRRVAVGCPDLAAQARVRVWAHGRNHLQRIHVRGAGAHACSMAPAACASDQVGDGRSAHWKSTAAETLGLHAEQGNLSAIPTPKYVTSFGNEGSEVQCCMGKATIDMQMGQWPVLDLESVHENLEFSEGWLHLALEVGFELSTRTSEHTNLMLGLASAYHLSHACCHGLIPRSGGGKSNQAREEVNLQHSGRLKNVGIVFIEDGEISKEDLALEFSEIYKTLNDWTILVKFPPEIPVESIARYSCFGLPKSNVTVKIEAWKGETEASASEQLVWIKIRKINPRWGEWSILDQIISVFGTLVDVDSQFNFKSFYEVVRVKFSCKDASKIHKERIFGINGNFYQMLIEVEPITEQRAKTRTVDNDTINQGGQETQSETETSSRTENNRSNKSTMPNLGRVGGSDPTLGKQAMLAFLQQLPDVCPSERVEHPSILKSQIPPSLQASRISKIDKIVAESVSDDQCYSILREMELDEDENCYIDLHQEMVEVCDTQEQAIVASGEPLSDTYEADFPLLSQTVAKNQHKQKWGPIQTTMHNSRMEPSGKTMLEKAQELKQVRDLETAKTGYCEDSQAAQDLGDLVHTSRGEKFGGLLNLPGGENEDSIGHQKWLSWDKMKISNAEQVDHDSPYSLQDGSKKCGGQPELDAGPHVVSTACNSSVDEVQASFL